MHPLVFKVFSGGNNLLYRLSGGRLGNTFDGLPILLLTVIGRKSGEARTVPLVYMRDGAELVVAASKGGDPDDPAWWLNLKANRRARVQIGTQMFDVEAHEAEGIERDRLWPRLVTFQPRFAQYQAHTARRIPVVVLRPLNVIRIEEPRPNPFRARTMGALALAMGVGVAAWYALRERADDAAVAKNRLLADER